MRIVGLTGNVASGKSSVAAIWREEGVPVVSADELAREVVEPGMPALDEIVEAFGPRILTQEKTLDRGALRRIVFRDAHARERLEAILHPRIEARRNEWLEGRRKEGADLVVAEIPLLFEVGMEGAFDQVVFVDASENIRLERLTEARGLEREEAERIIRAQMEPDLKRERADFVLANEGTAEELRTRALELLRRLRPHGMPGVTAPGADREADLGSDEAPSCSRPREGGRA